jgi:hypothetical protein
MFFTDFSSSVLGWLNRELLLCWRVNKQAGFPKSLTVYTRFARAFLPILLRIKYYQSVTD